jgi:hypothetical protein
MTDQEKRGAYDTTGVPKPRPPTILGPRRSAANGWRTTCENERGWTAALEGEG